MASALQLAKPGMVEGTRAFMLQTLAAMRRNPRTTGGAAAFVGTVLGLLAKLGMSSAAARRGAGPGKKRKRRTVNVDGEFVRTMRGLIRIIIPGLWTKEAFLLLAHTATLICRTFLSMFIARLDGKITKAIVRPWSQSTANPRPSRARGVAEALPRPPPTASRARRFLKTNDARPRPRSQKMRASA